MEIAARLPDEIERNVTAALAEDIGSGDLTALLTPAHHPARGIVVSREEAVLCGTGWFDACFHKLDAQAHIRWHAVDGARIHAGQMLCEIEADTRALLTAERPALNFLQLLSGTATVTRKFVDAVAGTRAKIVDTRKTLPGLRIAQKYAVRAGGGGNHRLALWDAILIKENHIHAAGGIAQAMAAAQKVASTAADRCQFIQVEVESLAELRQALDAGAKMILLDNFTPELMRQAVAINAGRAVLEASGNVSLETIRGIAETVVDRISVGALTKDVKALDLSMRFIG